VTSINLKGRPKTTTRPKGGLSNTQP
jgi:hypothetical protein